MKNEELSRVVQSVVSEIGKTKMTLSLAKKLISCVEEKAAEIGVNAVVAVSNEAGNVVAVECMDDAYIASYDVAVSKAFTVVALKMSTIQLKDLAQPNCPLYGIQFTNNGKIVVFGGGDPLKYNGTVVGGLGVSGGSEEQDTMLSEYGAKMFEKLIERS